jgi:hypothetical protein
MPSVQLNVEQTLRLFKLCEHVRVNVDRIRAERTKNGLENRTDEPPISQCRPPQASVRP